MKIEQGHYFTANGRVDDPSAPEYQGCRADSYHTRKYWIAEEIEEAHFPGAIRVGWHFEREEGPCHLQVLYPSKRTS